jgi:hypothetical protein
MIPISGIGAAFLLINMALILILPKRWAALPLLIGACYMTLGQGIVVGPFHFPVIRLIILTGIVRVLVRNERPSNGLNAIDYSIIVWAVWAVASSSFHRDPMGSLIFGLGMLFNVCGIYFLIRTFCETQEHVIGLCRITIILLSVVALEMLYEKLAAHNLFSLLGGIQATPDVRDGKLRAQGPFAHAILGGTVGAVCLPLAAGLWQQNRWVSLIGILACSLIVITSNSSGPLMSAIFAIGALWFWRYRHLTHVVRSAAVVTYLLADLVMKAPAYYLIARIDLTGSSSGYHRARLIESSIEHIDEWWLAGTDYTRHWMPTGVSWSPDHTDITNHYLQMGVVGGLPLMLLFIVTLWKGFGFVGEAISDRSPLAPEGKFFCWALGASLFAHAATSISVSYFDQSYVFLYLTLVAISVSRGALTRTHAQPNEIHQQRPIPDDGDLANKPRLAFSRPKQTTRT